jgi:hypothetical protein
VRRCCNPDDPFVTGLWYWPFLRVSSHVRVSPGQCLRYLRLGRAALIGRVRAVAVYYFPARGISRRLNAQLPLPVPSSAAGACEQTFSRELLVGLTRGHGSCAGALAEVFAESALDLIIPQAMNRSRPIGSNRPSAAGHSFD